MAISLKTNSTSRGLTLLEMIVTIAILTTLAGVVVPLVKSAIEDAKISKVMNLIQQIRKAANKYWYDTGNLPIEDATVPKYELFSNPGLPGGNWKGPYIDSPLSRASNPWGGEVRLEATLTGEVGQGNGFLIAAAPQTGSGSQLIIENVPASIAAKLENLIDSTASRTKGICEYSLIGVGFDQTANLYIFLFKAN